MIKHSLVNVDSKDINAKPRLKTKKRQKIWQPKKLSLFLMITYYHMNRHINPNWRPKWRKKQSRRKRKKKFEIQDCTTKSKVVLEDRTQKIQTLNLANHESSVQISHFLSNLNLLLAQTQKLRTSKWRNLENPNFGSFRNAHFLPDLNLETSNTKKLRTLDWLNSENPNFEPF